MKICALAVICVVMGVLIKQINSDISFAVRTVGSVMIFGVLFISTERLIDSLQEVWAFGGEYTQIMIKALGIALLTHVTASICRDCGEGSVASGVEFAGKLEILFLCLPIIVKILGYAASIAALGKMAQ